jgi:hypothetical protein
LSSFGFDETNSKLSAFTIQDIRLETSLNISEFLFFAYIFTQIVLLGIILLSALIDLISLITSSTSLLSFSISSFLSIHTLPHSASIKSQENHSL